MLSILKQKAHYCLIACLIFTNACLPVLAWAMESSNYRIEKDSINFVGTDFSDSQNYTLSDTGGEVATGTSDGKCFALDVSAGGKASTPYSSSLDVSDNLSISLWIKPKVAPTNYATYLVHKSSTTADANYRLYYFGTPAGVDAGKIRFLANRGGVWGAISTSYTPLVNAWVHVALSYNSATGGQMYIDGKPYGDRVGSGVLMTNTEGVRLVDNFSFPGILDDLRIYGRALTDAEIRDIFVGKEVDGNQLRVWWKFNEGSGTTASDSSGHNNVATLQTGSVFTTDAPGSTCVNLSAGYRQMDEHYLAISSPSDVTMSPAIGGVSGGTGNGSATWKVLTDNPAGYSLFVKASTAPALKSGANAFADYTPATAGTPDFAWSVDASDAEFGFSPEGAGVIQKFLDNGSVCAVGSANGADSCWAGFSTDNQAIVNYAVANHPYGSDTVLKFRAQSGTSHLQPAGTYAATITVTAVSL